MHTYKKNQEGITLLITLLLMGVLLGVSTSLLNITLKQFQLSGISYVSEIGFQAASAGMECSLYHDFVNNEFDVLGEVDNAGNPVTGVRNNISCFGVQSSDALQPTDAIADSGDEQRFQFTWRNDPSAPQICTEISVYKFFLPDNLDGLPDTTPLVINGVTMRPTPCPEGSECTIVQSRGYNVDCASRATNARVVEREYTQIY